MLQRVDTVVPVELQGITKTYGHTSRLEPIEVLERVAEEHVEGSSKSYDHLAANTPRLVFTSDAYHLGDNGVLTSASYIYLRPGARVRIRMAGEVLAIEADIAYRGVLDVGAIAGAFGQGAGAHGFDVGAGLTGHLEDLGFSYGLRMDYVGYWLSFSGMGTETIPGTSGVESAVRVTLRLGWAVW